MIAILTISAILVTLCVMFHGLVLQVLGRLLFQSQKFSFYRISLLIFFVILAHIVEITFFQVAYAYMVPADQHGAIAGVDDPDLHDLFYFSATTYTSTGYGDLTPTGNLRFLATVEALTGLIMIAWTASLAFFIMQRYWEDHAHAGSDSS